jgi:peroxiredoxin
MKKLFKLIVMSAAVVFIGMSFTNDNEKKGYKVGDKAADFKLKNVDGKMVSMADYKDAKGFIITFTCNHCPYSVLYEDRKIALHNKYAAKGYPVIAINPNDAVKQPQDSFEKMQVRAKEKGFPFAYLQDETQEFAKLYGATNTPHMYVLEKVGSELIVRYIGAIDNNSKEASKADKKYVEEAVDALLAGQPVAETKTKAIGCTIKWKDAKGA